MARINLRDYLREIDDLIDNGRTDEAIAHSRYVLELYPKHVETYRLLGKAYLETQRYSDAADVLQRVLSSIPDDFISHLGMSIIREDEGNFEAAIWHMERAFEMQPSNAAIQGELRRLYGRRDGLEPSKIHLTRGALARMYAKGELYEQAIAEIRATLAQEPQRTDLQVLLARMYAENGQHVEAAKICSNILQGYPNCKEANQILGEILPGTERSDEAVNYHRRLQAMDPYAAHLSPSTPSSEYVPDNVITLERHEWTPGDTGEAKESRPDWAASLGVELGTNATDDETLPDWLSDPTDDEKTPAFTSETGDIESLSREDDPEELLSADSQDENSVQVPDSPSTVDQPPDETDEIPDWMQSAGWESANESSEAASSPFEVEDETEEIDDEIEPAEIPDWLQSMSPISTDSDLPIQETQEEDLEGEPVSWLDEKTPGASDSIVTWLQTKDQIEPDDDTGIEAVIETDSEEIEEQLSDSVTEADDQQISDEGMPDWLSDLGEETILGTAQERLSDLELETPELIPQSLDESTSSEEITEWLKDLDSKSSVEEISESLGDLQGDIPENIEEEDIDALPAEDIPEWLRDISAETSVEGTSEPIEEIGAQGSEIALQIDDHTSIPEDFDDKLLVTSEESTTDDTIATFADPGAELQDEITQPEETLIAAIDKELESADEVTRPEEEPQPVEDISEWLSELSEEVPIEQIQEQAEDLEVDVEDSLHPDEAEPTLEEDMPEWLLALSEETRLEDSKEPTSDFMLTTPEKMGQTEVEATLEADAPELHRALDEKIEAEEISEPSLTKTGETIMEDQEKIPELSSEDEDAAMAWLESLAAKQGVDEEELLTAPSERHSAPPDWVQQLAAESEPIEQDVESTPDELVPADVHEAEELVPGFEPDVVSEAELEHVSGPDDETEGIPDWLQDLVEDSSSEEEFPISPIPVADLPPAEPEVEPTEDILSEWLQDLADESTTASTEPALIEPPTIDDDTQPTRVTEEVAELSEILDSEMEAGPGYETSIPDKEGVEVETTMGEQPDEVSLQPVDEAETIPVLDRDLPEWLKDSEITDTVEPTIQEIGEEEPKIPDWMSADDALPESKEISEPAQILDDEDVEEEPELPEWITSEEVAEEPLEIPEPAQILEDEEVEEEPEIPEWIAAVEAVEAAADTIEAPQPTPMLADEEVEEEPELPEWITSEEVAEEPLETPEPSQVPEDEEVEVEPEIPEWITTEEAAADTIEAPLPTSMLADEEVEEEPEIPEWITTEEVTEKPLEIPEPAQMLADEETEGEPEIPEWITAEEAAADTIEAPQPTPVLADEEFEEEPEIPEWVTAEEADEETVETSEPEQILQAEALEEELEIPEWIKAEETMEQVPEAVDEAETILAIDTAASKVQIEETLIEEPVEEELPSPVNINTASFKALERLPGIGPVIAQTIIDHRATHGSFKDVDSIQDVPGIGPKTLAILRDHLNVEDIEESTTRPVSPEEKTLAEGRRALEAGNITEAYEQYAQLIEEEQFLDSVIEDLKDAQYRYPVEVSIYELLGDAYMRTDQIQEAIDTYTKAEELLA